MICLRAYLSTVSVHLSVYLSICLSTCTHTNTHKFLFAYLSSGFLSLFSPHLWRGKEFPLSLSCFFSPLSFSFFIFFMTSLLDRFMPHACRGWGMAAVLPFFYREISCDVPTFFSPPSPALFFARPRRWKFSPLRYIYIFFFSIFFSLAYLFLLRRGAMFIFVVFVFQVSCLASSSWSSWPAPERSSLGKVLLSRRSCFGGRPLW